MDKYDRDKFAEAYRILADVLQRDRQTDAMKDHLSFILGDVVRRVFVGTKFDPPDELLEAAAGVLRTGDAEARKEMALRLRQNATHLNQMT